MGSTTITYGSMDHPLPSTFRWVWETDGGGLASLHILPYLVAGGNSSYHCALGFYSPEGVAGLPFCPQEKQRDRQTLGKDIQACQAYSPKCLPILSILLQALPSRYVSRGWGWGSRKGPDSLLQVPGCSRYWSYSEGKIFGLYRNPGKMSHGSCLPP